MKKSLKSYFITGLLVVVPLYITAYVFILIVGFMDSIVKVLPQSLRPDTYLPFHIPGIGIIFTLLAIFFIGVLATNLLGRKLVEIGERILTRIPVLRAVYKATKQFMETFFAGDHDGFRKVVLVEYPRKGLYSIGFVTGRTRGEVQDKTVNDTINIFVPTTPNPTSGYYIVASEREVIPLDMSVEDAFKLIMTGGMVIPSEEHTPGRKGNKKDSPGK